MFRTLGRAEGLFLGALLLAGAAPGQIFHKVYYKGDKPNELTSVYPAKSGGYIATANFSDGAALLKLQANGDVQWTRHYDGPSLLQVVQVRSHSPYNPLIGNESAATRTIPFIAATDPTDGSLKWKSALRIGPGMNAKARALGTDADSYWVGGTGRPDSGGADPWIARIQSSGNVLWARSFHFGHPCELNSLITGDDGTVGVGQVLVDVNGTPRQRMFAFKVDTLGNLKWAFRYDAVEIDPAVSQQWLADITTSGSRLHVAGVATGLCTPLISPCVQRPRSILVATIDLASGSLQKVWAIREHNGRSLWAYTIASSSDRLAVGGRVDNAAESEALLLSGMFGDHQVSLLQGKLYGDGAGPFSSQVEDLARAAGSAPEGWVLAMTEHSSFRPAIVRTDQNLSTDQPCQYGISLAVEPVSTQPIHLAGTHTDYKTSEVKILDSPIQPSQKSCSPPP